MRWKALRLLAFLVTVLMAFPATADIRPYPDNFSIREIQTNGTKLHVRVGGTGSAVVLLHGFADTGDMWEPLAEAVGSEHTVIVPDLRGMGLSEVAD